MSHSTIVWFRHDLRLDDNPALTFAVRRELPVIPVYIWSPEEEDCWAPGSASRWWLYQSLKGLQLSLKSVGCDLIIGRGASANVLQNLAQETGADIVCWNKRYEPESLIRDRKVSLDLAKCGIEARVFGETLLFDPEKVQAESGAPYKVFTAYWNACQSKQVVRQPLGCPNNIIASQTRLQTLSLEELGLEPVIDWAGGLRRSWSPGESGASDAWQTFFKNSILDYMKGRDFPSRDSVSRLSPHLHFGEISPHRLWWQIQDGLNKSDKRFADNAKHFLRELAWREFAHYLLYHFPKTTNVALQQKFQDMPWRKEKLARTELKAWQKGKTGYPIVDAGMRQLWETGWMHNRVRMIVASFLCKDLLISWTEGARWFWDTLVDADLANNTFGWQWSAGCGADAAPFFRIFNPVLQGSKFDPDGDYVKQWVPELRNLPPQWIHKPWQANSQVLRLACVELGKNYPFPIVDHASARERALAAFKAIGARKE